MMKRLEVVMSGAGESKPRWFDSSHILNPMPCFSVDQLCGPLGLPWQLSGENKSACNAGDAGDAGSIPGLGRSPGGVNGNPLQYSCLGNPMDRGPWWARVHGAAREVDMT